MVQFAKGWEYLLRHDTAGAGLKRDEEKMEIGRIREPAEFGEAMVSAI